MILARFLLRMSVRSGEARSPKGSRLSEKVGALFCSRTFVGLVDCFYSRLSEKVGTLFYSRNSQKLLNDSTERFLEQRSNYEQNQKRDDIVTVLKYLYRSTYAYQKYCCLYLC